MKAFRALSLLFITLSVFFQACSSTSNKPNIEFPSKAMLAIQDLPRGWDKGGMDFEDVPNAESITVSYLGSSNPRESHIFVSHQLSAYLDEASAQSAYSDWKAKWFSSDIWQLPENWKFEPLNSTDIIKFGCVYQTINDKAFAVCTFLQQHRNLISLVHANIDGETLTIPEFEEAMITLDARLNQEVP